MEKHILVVFSSARPDQDEDYNRWYDDIHLQDILASKGFAGARRYLLSDHQMPGKTPSPHRYLTIYEVETDDLQDALETLNAAADGMVVSPAADRSTAMAYVFHPIGPRVSPLGAPETAAAFPNG